MDSSEILEYWQSQICGENFRSSFLQDEKYINKYKVSFEKTVISELEKNIENITKGKPILTKIVHLATLSLTLYHLTGDNKILILTPLNGDLIPFIIEINPNITVRSFLNKIINTIKDMNKYSGFSLDNIIKFLNLDKDFNNFIIVCMDDEKELDCVKLNNSNEKLLLSNQQIEFRYNEHQFTKYQIKNYLKYYKNIFVQILEYQDTYINNLQIFDKEELNCYLNSWQGEKIKTNENIDIFSLFYKNYNEVGDKTALVYGEESISYSELFFAVENIVKELKNYKIKSGDYVAVICTQTPKTIAIILAIIQIGAIYVPIDKNTPEEKIKYILNDSKAKILVSTCDFETEIFNLPVLNVSFNTVKSNIYDYDNIDLGLYIIYTSGTTGKSKGVLINKRQFYNLFIWYKSTYNITNSSKVALLTNFAFDASIKNILTPLLVGGTLVLAVDELFYTDKILDIIEKNVVTHINCVPALFNSLLEIANKVDYKQLKRLQYAILGGEALNTIQITEWSNSDNFNCIISNVYGPTEGTDLSTYYILNAEDLKYSKHIPIGKPIYNRNIYVLNENMKMCPPNEKGILYISGVGVINKYLNNELFDNKFVNNPFLNGSYLYNTGDIVSWTDDGNLIFYGRKDNQVKINGQRIELDEIESIINQISEIKKSIALVENNNLVIYYQLVNNNIEFNDLEIKKICSEWFTKSIMPNRYIKVDKFPLNSNGKIDRNALRKQFDFNINFKQDENVTKIESILIDAWKETLNIDSCSITKPFFEMGGNSLLLSKLKLQVEKRIGIEISILDFFEYITIKQFAKFLECDKKYKVTNHI